MTTLPNTASIRLPRQTSAGQLSGPNGNGHLPALAPHGPSAMAFPVAHGGGAAGAAPLSPADVWLIILSLMVAAAGGWAVNQYILKPYYSRYTSTALCRVYTDSMKKMQLD